MRSRLGLIVAGATLSLGFGAMALFSKFADYPKDVPGLFDYRSAVIGDAFLLPTISGILANEIGRHPVTKIERRAFIGFAVAGSITGVLVVRSWLDGSPSSDNWTQIGGKLNGAGMYHAAFLSLCSGLLTGTLALLGVRLRNSSVEIRREVLESQRLGVLLGSALAFLLLLGWDNLEGDIRLANVISLSSALGPFLIIAVAIAIAVRKYRVRFRMSLLVIVSVSVSFLALGFIQTSLSSHLFSWQLAAASVIAVLISGSTWLEWNRQSVHFAGHYLILPIALLVIVGFPIWFAAHIPAVYLVLLSVVLAFLPVFFSGYLGISKTSRRKKRFRGLITPQLVLRTANPHRAMAALEPRSPLWLLVYTSVLLASGGMLRATVPEDQTHIITLANGIAVTLLGSRVSSIAMRYYDSVQIASETDDDPEESHIPSVIISGYGLAVLISVAWLILSELTRLTSTLPNALGPGVIIVDFVVPIAVLTTLLLLPLFLLSKRIPTVHLASALSAFLLLIGAAPWLLSWRNADVGWAMSPDMVMVTGLMLAAIYLSTLFGFLCAMELQYNIFRIQALDFDQRAASICITAGVMIWSYMVWLLAILFPAVDNSQLVALFTCVIPLLLPVWFMWSISTILERHYGGFDSMKSNPETKDWVLHSPTENTSRDVLFFCIVVALSYVSVVSLMALARASMAVMDDIVFFIGVGVPFIFADLLRLALSNNLNHIKRQGRRLRENPTANTLKSFNAVKDWIPLQIFLAQAMSPVLLVAQVWNQGVRADKQASFDLCSHVADRR